MQNLGKRIHYYFDDIIKLEDFDHDNILINEKSHENILIYAKIKVNSYDSLTIEKILNLKSITILIKSVLGKDKNYYYYKIIFRKCSYRVCKK